MIGNGEGKTTLSYLKWAFISTVIGLALGACLTLATTPTTTTRVSERSRNNCQPTTILRIL